MGLNPRRREIAWLIAIGGILLIAAGVIDLTRIDWAWLSCLAGFLFICYGLIIFDVDAGGRG